MKHTILAITSLIDNESKEKISKTVTLDKIKHLFGNMELEDNDIKSLSFHLIELESNLKDIIFDGDFTIKLRHFFSEDVFDMTAAQFSIEKDIATLGYMLNRAGMNIQDIDKFVNRQFDTFDVNFYHANITDYEYVKKYLTQEEVFSKQKAISCLSFNKDKVIQIMFIDVTDILESDYFKDNYTLEIQSKSQYKTDTERKVFFLLCMLNNMYRYKEFMNSTKDNPDWDELDGIKLEWEYKSLYDTLYAIQNIMDESKFYHNDYYKDIDILYEHEKLSKILSKRRIKRREKEEKEKQELEKQKEKIEENARQEKFRNASKKKQELDDKNN